MRRLLKNEKKMLCSERKLKGVRWCHQYGFLNVKIIVFSNTVTPVMWPQGKYTFIMYFIKKYLTFNIYISHAYDIFDSYAYIIATEQIIYIIEILE